MADIAGLISSILTFIEVGQRIVSRLQDFGRHIQDVPKTFRAIAVETPLLIETLGRIERQASAGLLDGRYADALRNLIAECLTQLNRLDVIFEKILPSKEAPNWQKFRQALKSLTYDKEIERIVNELERHVQLLTFDQTARNLDLSQQILMRGSQPAGLPLKPVFLVPFDRGTFVGREDIINRIQQSLNSRTRRIAIAGIGGIGKSRIAIECCYRFKEQTASGHVFWVHGSTLRRFGQGYRDIAKGLNLQGLDSPDIDLFETVKLWLSDESNGPWLMILDNADDSDVYFKQDSMTSIENAVPLRKRLADFLPQSSNGSILITTRDKRAGANLAKGQPSIIVPPMLLEEARLVLRAALPDDLECKDDDLDRLLDAIDCLPLAITQTGAFIREQEVSVEHYLELLRDDSDMKDVLELEHYDSNRDAEISNCFLSAMILSFNQIARRSPRAAEMLSLMAVLERQSVMDVFLRNPEEGKVAFDVAMGTLKAFSLITEEKAKGLYSMHRLVQISTRWWLEKRGLLKDWEARAVDIVFRNCPENGEFENWIMWEAFNPHLETVLRYDTMPQALEPRKVTILTRASEYDWRRQRYKSAAEKARQSLEIQQRSLGTEHRDTLECKAFLAVCLSDDYQYEESEALFREVLACRKSVLGDLHDDTVVAIACLLKNLCLQGKYDEAEKVARDALEIRESHEGENNGKTQQLRQLLAKSLSGNAKHDEAVNLFEEFLRWREEQCDKEHPENVQLMNESATALYLTGRYEDAEAMYREILSLREKSFGAVHPLTVGALNSLGDVLACQQRYSEAEDMHRQAIARMEIIHDGNLHEFAFSATRHLAWDLANQGKWEEGEILLREAYVLRRDKLGEDDSQTKEARECLEWLQDKYQRNLERSPWKSEEIQQSEGDQALEEHTKLDVG